MYDLSMYNKANITINVKFKVLYLNLQFYIQQINTTTFTMTCSVEIQLAIATAIYRDAFHACD